MCHAILLYVLAPDHLKGVDGSSLWAHVLPSLTGGSSGPPRPAPELMSTSPIVPVSGYSLQWPPDTV